MTIPNIKHIEQVVFHQLLIAIHARIFFTRESKAMGMPFHILCMIAKLSCFHAQALVRDSPWGTSYKICESLFLEQIISHLHYPLLLVIKHVTLQLMIMISLSHECEPKVILLIQSNQQYIIAIIVGKQFLMLSCQGNPTLDMETRKGKYPCMHSYFLQCFIELGLFLHKIITCMLLWRIKPIKEPTYCHDFFLELGQCANQSSKL